MNTTALDHAPVRVFAPLVFAGEFVIGALLQSRAPLAAPAGALRWSLGLALIALGLAFGLTARSLMSRAGTSPNPLVPSTALVETGPFRLSRNPLYVSMVLVFGGLAFLLRTPWALVLMPVAIAVVQVWAIVPEERYLAERFGDAYAAYRARVRRWI
jgi:protein-S-isoprenylcysteine O-methyltransferase Ste14